MGKCAACGFPHPHPGEKSCKYSKDAKEKCKAAGESEGRWREFLDLETLNTIAKSEGPGSYLTVDDLKILKQADEEQKEQLSRLQKDMAKITSQLGSLLSLHPAPVAPAAAAVTVTAPDPFTLPLAPVSAAVTVTSSDPFAVTTPVTSVTLATTTITSPVFTTTPLSAGVSPPSLHVFRPTVIPPLRPPHSLPSSGVPIPTHTPTYTGGMGPWSVGHLPGHGGVSWSAPTRPLVSLSASTGSHPGLYHSHPTPTSTYGSTPSYTHTTNIPASYLSSPLTAALGHIADNDPIQPGMNLRPEFVVLHKQEGEPIKQISYKALSYRKLIHGMVLIARSILSQGGNVDEYLGHMEYVTRHGKNGDYTDQAYAEYDKIVIDNYVQNPTKGIIAGDVMASSYCFHDVTRVKIPTQRPMAINKKKNKIKTRASDPVPDDYPIDNCFYWNYKSCMINNCGRSHVCRICGEDHRAPSCPRRKQ